MNCADYFASTGFLDLLPLAQELAQTNSYNEAEMIEAVAMTFDKSRECPPLKNRTKWFQIVFTEKLAEARAEITRFAWDENRRARLRSLQ